MNSSFSATQHIPAPGTLLHRVKFHCGTGVGSSSGQTEQHGFLWHPCPVPICTASSSCHFYPGLPQIWVEGEVTQPSRMGPSGPFWRSECSKRAERGGGQGGGRSLPGGQSCTQGAFKAPEIWGSGSEDQTASQLPDSPDGDLFNLPLSLALSFLFIYLFIFGCVG